MAGGNLPYGLVPSGELTAYKPTLRERGQDLMRRLLFTDDRAGQGKAENLSNVLEFSPYGLATGMYDAGRAGGQGDYGTAGMMMAMAGLPGPNPKGFKAYHGSPHDFDRFTLDKIGTGEGAQAYGHGLYFADSEVVAKSYRDQLSGLPGVDGSSVFQNLPWTSRNTEKLARAAIQKATNAGLTGDDAIRAAMEDLSAAGNTAPASHVRQPYYDATNAIGSLLGKKWDVNPGKMYEVQINADPDSFLDWDKPLSEQPDVLKSLEPMFGPRAAEFTGQDVVKKASGFDSMVNVARKSGDSAATLLPTIFPDATPEQIAGAIKAAKGTDSGPQIATSMLRDKGIPGIKYLDQGSRTKGDGSRNYVVFDDKLIEILKKYGWAGAAPFGLAPMIQDDRQDY